MSAELLPHFHCWSLSAKDGDPAALRELATIKQHLRSETLTKWCQSLSDQEGLFYLATCHRVELYAWTSKPTSLVESWIHQSTQDPVTRFDFQKSLSHFHGEAALEHLIKVCSGLESEVLGETQILGQVKDAVKEAKESGWLRGPIDRASQMAFRVAKKLRSQSKIGEGTVSIAHAAIEGLSDVFEDLSDKRFLVVGAGTMALQSLDKLWSSGAKQITWINRSFEKMLGSEWAQKVECRPLSDLTNQILISHVSILATRSEEPLVTKEALTAKPIKTKNIGPQIILDLGLPRNVAENVHGTGRLMVRNVDEFSDRSMKGHAKRAEAANLALELLKNEMKICLKDWNHYHMAPAKRDLMISIQELKAQTLNDLKLDKNADLEYVIHSIYGKLSHRLLEELDQLQDDEVGHRVLEIINRAWRRPQTNGSQEKSQFNEKTER